MQDFKSLGLSAPVLKSISEMGFTTPSQIQSLAIPPLLSSDRDLIGLAQTGTGKTAAFALPLLERLDDQSRFPQALILSPTRELGQQIAQQIEAFSKYLPQLRSLAVYGGAPIQGQIKSLKKGPQIIIATPGRLADLIRRKAIKLNNIEYLVLDEADEMLNMGFKEELDFILSTTPEYKLTWLFSATMPKAIRSMTHRYMHEPLEIQVDRQLEVNKKINHQFTQVKEADKGEALKRFLDLEPQIRGIAFCRTKRETKALTEKLLQDHYQVDALHGDLSQNQRDQVMQRFRSGALSVLIATDVAARGLDVNDLSHVFHLNLPDDPSAYTHRSGRTARAGKSGISMVLVNAREKNRLAKVEKELGIEFSPRKIPGAEQILESRLKKWAEQIADTPNELLPSSKTAVLHQAWSTMSKEELVDKLAHFHYQQLNLGSERDLNDRSKAHSQGRRKGGKPPFRRKKKPYRGKRH